MTTNILFVDDEKNLLMGMKRMLYALHSQWTTYFAVGGEEALKQLEEHPIDVIVSDMRMPGMDGSELLAKVKDKYPGIIRIILSGHTSMDSSFRAVPVAHQFLCKPLEPDLLRKTVDRTFACRSELPNKEIQNAVGRIDNLPSLFQTKQKLQNILKEKNPSPHDLSEIIEGDIGLFIKILQIANCAFFGLPRRMTNIHDAVSYLGMDVLKQLAVEIPVLKDSEGLEQKFGLSVECLQKHSLLTSRIAGKMLEGKAEADDAISAGIVHDAGILIMALYLPELMEKVMTTVSQKKISIEEAEREILGFDHGQIGAYLLGVWGLPEILATTAKMHLSPPSEKMDPTAGPVEAVYAAHCLAEQYISPFESKGAPGSLNNLFSEWASLAKECYDALSK